MESLALQQDIFREVTEIMNTPDFKRYGEELSILVKECEAIKVKDDGSEKFAVEKVTQVKGLYKRIEEKRKEVTEKPRQLVNAVNGMVKEWTASLDYAEKHIKGELRQYQHRLELERRKEEEAAQRKIDKLQEKFEKEAGKAGVEAPKIPDAVVPKREPVVRTDSGKVSSRKVWKAELVDIKVLAKSVAEGKAQKEILTVNMVFVNALLRAGVREIPGFRIYQEDQISVSTR